MRLIPSWDRICGANERLCQLYRRLSVSSRKVTEEMLKRSIIVPVAVLGVAAILLFTIRGCWTSWEGGKAEQQTDDAYVRADVTPMSTRVSGTVKKVDVGDFESVKPGQPLVELEDADYRADLAEAEAALAGAQAQLEDNHAAKRVQDAKIQSAEASVIQATAAVNA